MVRQRLDLSGLVFKVVGRPLCWQASLPFKVFVVFWLPQLLFANGNLANKLVALSAYCLPAVQGLVASV
jgi:hypothetical protein